MTQCTKHVVTATKVVASVVTDSKSKKRTIVTAGLRGAPGSNGDKHMPFTQGTPSALWTIDHALAKYPSVEVVDSAGSLVEGDVTYISDSRLTVEFSNAFSGIAYLN